MKKYLMAICTIAMLAFPVLFTSCSKLPSKTIVGTWNHFEGGNYSWDFTFRNDGSGYAHYEWEQGKTYKFSYDINNRKGTIVFKWNGDWTLLQNGGYMIDFYDSDAMIIGEFNFSRE